eukprot:6586464-Prymnesium_polylepis.2
MRRMRASVSLRRAVSRAYHTWLSRGRQPPVRATQREAQSEGGSRCGRRFFGPSKVTSISLGESTASASPCRACTSWLYAISGRIAAPAPAALTRSYTSRRRSRRSSRPAICSSVAEAMSSLVATRPMPVR